MRTAASPSMGNTTSASKSPAILCCAARGPLGWLPNSPVMSSKARAVGERPPRSHVPLPQSIVPPVNCSLSRHSRPPQRDRLRAVARHAVPCCRHSELRVRCRNPRNRCCPCRSGEDSSHTTRWQRPPLRRLLVVLRTDDRLIGFVDSLKRVDLGRDMHWINPVTMPPGCTEKARTLELTDRVQRDGENKNRNSQDLCAIYPVGFQQGLC